MKLRNLLKKITGLPWTFCIYADPQQGHIMGCERLVADLQACAATTPEQAKANLAYITHAANVLPQLVEAAKTVQTSLPYGPHLNPWANRALASLRAAIAKAETINPRT